MEENTSFWSELFRSNPELKKYDHQLLESSPLDALVRGHEEGMRKRLVAAFDPANSEIHYYTEGNDMQSFDETNQTFDPDFYLRESARLAAVAEHLKGIPQQDPFESGQILAYTKTGPDMVEHAFAAVKSDPNGLWRVSGSSSRAFTWRQLLEYIGLGNLSSIIVVTGGEKLKEWKAPKVEDSK